MARKSLNSLRSAPRIGAVFSENVGLMPWFPLSGKEDFMHVIRIFYKAHLDGRRSTTKAAETSKIFTDSGGERDRAL